MKDKKDSYLGVKIHTAYMEKLEKRRVKNGDDNLSQTARKILYKGLDTKKGE